MTKRFETKEDLEREEKAILLLCEEYCFEYEKLGYYDLDFKIFDRGRFLGYAEVKGRNKEMNQAFSLPLAKRKYDKMMSKEGHKIIIWACYDGIIFGDLSKLLYVEREGGRKPREGSANDIEMMHYYIDQNELNRLSYVDESELLDERDQILLKNGNLL